MTAGVLEGAPARGVFSVPDGTGHAEITWDPEDEAEVAVARAAFNAATKQSMRVYRKGDGPHGTAGELVTKFDPSAGEYVAFQAPVGG